MKDPVCGMDVSPGKAAGNTNHDGKTYLFCSEKCQKKFREDPKHYLDKEELDKASTAKDGQRIYTCPMHPEVDQLSVQVAFFEGKKGTPLLRMPAFVFRRSSRIRDAHTSQLLSTITVHSLTSKESIYCKPSCIAWSD